MRPYHRSIHYRPLFQCRELGQRHRTQILFEVLQEVVDVLVNDVRWMSVALHQDVHGFEAADRREWSVNHVAKLVLGT